MSRIVLGGWANGGFAKLDLPRLLESRLLLQAASGLGKSWALRRLLEVTAGQVQQIIIDPEGEFASLREKHDLLIVAGTGGDALAHPKTAALLATRLLETGVSAVIDIYDLKKRDREDFVRLFTESLVNAPKDLWHAVLLAIDEVHMFCDEHENAKSTQAIIDVATRGRKRGLCLVAATQRIADFNKSAAAQLRNKLIGGTTLDVDVKRCAFELGKSAKEAMAMLRSLNPGEFYGYGPALCQEIKLLTIGDVATTHPKVGHRQIAPPKPTAAIKAILPKLADLPKEAEEEARTITALQRELATVRRELALAAKPVRGLVVSSTAADRRQTAIVAKQTALIEELMKFMVTVSATDFRAGAEIDEASIEKAIKAAVVQSRKLMEDKMDARNRELQTVSREAGRLVARVKKLLESQDIKIDVEVRHNEPYTVVPPPKRALLPSKPNGDGSSLPPGEVAILSALIQYPAGLTRDQLTVLAGYKRSTRDAYIARLRDRGYVTIGGDGVEATPEGIAALPDAQPLPTGAALQEFWLARLPPGERKILEVLIHVYPEAVTRDAVTEQSGFKRSTRDAYLSRLASKELVEEPARGEVRATATLF